MKYRFAVELDFEGSGDDAQDLLDQIIHRGMRAFGHTQDTMPVHLIKLRSRGVKEMLEDKP